MAEIDIPFSPRMAEAALAGRKIATTRSHRKGDPGDIFPIEGVWFVLVDVMPTILLQVKINFYKLEGFSSPGAFEEYWRELHDDTWVDTAEKYTHFFARCPSYTPTKDLVEELKKREVIDAQGRWYG